MNLETTSPRSQSVKIVCASDDLYIPHAAAMLHSLRCCNIGLPIDLFFLCPSELAVTNRRTLANFCESLDINLSYIEVPDSLIRGLPTEGYLSKVVWYRIFMPVLLPNLRKVLFLDCDTIITGDINELWATEMGNHLFAAVTNVVEKRHAHRAAELGLSGPQDYFNAGVALWNLKAMREIDFTSNVIDFAKKNHSRLLWLEQDVINSLYSNKRMPLHPKWNYQNGMCFEVWGIRYLDAAELAEAKAKPRIIHFEGGEAGKPWHFMCKHPKKKLYFHHRKLTPWPLVRQEGLNFKNIVRRFFLTPLRQLLR